MKVTELILADRKIPLRIPYFIEGVSAGFPSPAENYLEEKLDLNEYLIAHPAATYFVRASGSSMESSIQHDDLLIVDKSLTPRHEDIIIAAYYGEFLVKQYIVRNNRRWLYPFNKEYPPLPVNEEDDFSCFGVVTHVIHSFRN
jgi:DNA polymerase V